MRTFLIGLTLLLGTGCAAPVATVPLYPGMPIVVPNAYDYGAPVVNWGTFNYRGRTATCQVWSNPWTGTYQQCW